MGRLLFWKSVRKLLARLRFYKLMKLELLKAVNELFYRFKYLRFRYDWRLEMFGR